MAKPWYLNEKGQVSLSQENWDKIKGDGTKKNPYTINGEKISGTMDIAGKGKRNWVNLVDGVIVEKSTEDSTISLDMTEPDVIKDKTAKPDVNARAKFGIGEALINHPIYGADIRKIFALLDAGDEAGAEEEYFKSAWGKLDTDAQQRILMQLENDNLYKERLKSWKSRIKPQLASRGLKADDATLDKYFLDGIDDATIFAELGEGVSAKGAAGEVADALGALRNVARNNGFNLDKDFAGQVDGWLRRISAGESVDDFARIIRQQAKLGLPEKVGVLLDEGLDLTNIYAPYRNVMAALLEVTPDSISLNDPLLRTAYGPEKEMSIYDFRRSIRKDPRWQYTDNAREEVSSSVLSVLRDFGFQG